VSLEVLQKAETKRQSELREYIFCDVIMIQVYKAETPKTDVYLYSSIVYVMGFPQKHPIIFSHKG